MTELGSRLKEARLAKDMSLDDLQIVTKIQKRYLMGIEEGNYSMMPGKFYVRAFIKQYAEAVGIEPEELFEQYKAEIPSTMNDDIPEKLSRVQSRKDLSGGNSRVFDILPKILIGIFIIGFIAVIYYFAQQRNAGEGAKEPADKNGHETVNVEESENFVKEPVKENGKDQTPEENTSGEDQIQEEVPEPPKQEITVAGSSGRNTVYELKNADKFEVKVVTTGESWVNILNGKGFSFFQGSLKKGDKESETVDFSKETEAVIIVGRSTETEIYVNDEKIEYAIPPAQSVRQDITIRYFPNNE
ncbi:DUF4115 domain-containing protein [Bacillus sp. FJAT-29790]|uniref:helix-turn-helix domain-containing protein n=1 Tax=Bacillus sp. FJAT-29790 TaxID=1895002 RepID=UPI001C239E3E|nr:RodZ domain-containing protein [Bacillus sp. FJAT-29790]MBU8877904.1 DUF4115 domain-containing protein [Bacillus sp. FJAT-29790]